MRFTNEDDSQPPERYAARHRVDLVEDIRRQRLRGVDDHDACAGQLLQRLQRLGENNLRIAARPARAASGTPVRSSREITRKSTSMACSRASVYGAGSSTTEVGVRRSIS